MIRALLVLALGAPLIAPAAASAHATLEATTPQRGARLDHAPAQIVLRFSEPVTVSLGAVKVFDAHGREAQQGDAFHPIGRSSQVAVRLRPDLPDGGYTATYRIVSADSHPVSGGFTFTVGDGPAGTATVADLLRGQTAGPATATAFSVVRGVQYGAIALGLGTLIFLVVVWLPDLAGVAGAEAFARRTRTLLCAAAAAGAIASILGILLEGAQGEGTSLWSAARDDVVRDVLSTRFGTVWAAALVIWLFVAACAIARASPLVLAVPLGALALLPALSGHAAERSPVALMLPANVLHVAAMAAWLGGIATLVLALRAATRRLDPVDRPRLLVGVVSRFSTLAGIAFAALFVTGAVQGVVEVASVSALVHTAFGRAVLIKLVLFGVLVGIGWANRTRLLPALRASRDSPGRAGVLLRRTLRMELGLGVAVLAVTGALAGYPPSTTAASGPVTREAAIGPARLQLTVDPATAGVNELHLYLFDARSGAQFTAAKETTVTAALPAKGIAELPLEVRRAGPGHAVGSGTLGVPGDWHLTVTVRVSDFDEYVAHLTVPIR